MSIRPGGGVDPIMFRGLHTDFSLDDALDLAEIDRVDRSWRAAAQANREHKQPPP